MDFELDHVDQLDLEKGKLYKVKSITHPLTREFFLVGVKLDLPDFVQLEKEEPLELEGTHGCIYVLKAKEPGNGILVSSMVDLRTDGLLVKKVIPISVF